MHESKDGEYVLLRDAAEPMQAALTFAIQRQCEIEDDVKDTGLRTHKTVVEQPAVKQIIPGNPAPTKRKSEKKKNSIK